MENKTEWTTESIINSAIEAIKNMDRPSSMIEDCAKDTGYMEWEIRVNSDGKIYSDSGIHGYDDNEVSIAKNTVGGHGPSMFLEWFGFVLNDDSEWIQSEPNFEITNNHVIDYLQTVNTEEEF